MTQDTPRLRIAETFASVQGEGIWVGVPSTFVRISGCNLRCVWCDTPYASWRPEGPIRDVADLVEEIERNALDHVVITGGEPMLFDAVADLAHACRANGKTITIETAGTLYRDLPCDLMSISPKLAHSTPGDPVWHDRHEATRLNLPVLQRLIDAYPYQLKFVVNPDAGDDLGEIEALLADLRGVEPGKVLIMPEGTDSASLHRRARALVAPVMARNWRLTQRLHIDLFGNTKGT
ncbi:MAG: 7-carboxy-7-deazaguanine synthase QueE [Fimbriimonas sp.]